MEASPETWAELPWVTSPAPSRGHACCPTGLTEVCPAWVLPEGRALAGGGWLGALWAQGLTGVPGKMALFGTPSTGRCAALILPTWWTDVALLAGPNSSWQQLAAACGQGLPLILGGCGSPTRAEREPRAWPAVPQALLQAAWEGRRPAPIPQLLWPERPHLSWGCRACFLRARGLQSQLPAPGWQGLRRLGQTLSPRHLGLPTLNKGTPRSPGQRTAPRGAALETWGGGGWRGGDRARLRSFQGRPWGPAGRLCRGFPVPG